MNEELYNKIAKIVYPSGNSRSYPFHLEQFTEVALLLDPYFFLRQAVKEGKDIEINLGNNFWVDVAHPCAFSNPPEQYRVKIEKPKIGEYFKHSNGDIYILTHVKTLMNIKNGYLWGTNTKDPFGDDFNSFEKVKVKIEETK